MTEALSHIELASDSDDVSEYLVLAPGAKAMGRMIGHAEYEEFFDQHGNARRVTDVLFFQQGLPGHFSRMNFEARFRQLVVEQRGLIVVSVLPMGMLKTPETTGIPQSDLDSIFSVLPDACVAQPFELSSFIQEVRHLAIAFRQTLKDLAGRKFAFHFHFVGHSYGGSAVLHSMTRLRRNDIPELSSASLLAPFVRTAIDTRDRRFRLDIHNNGIDTGRQRHQAPLDRLQSVLQECLGVFDVEDISTLMCQHRELFTDQFFQELLSLRRRVRRMSICTFLGTRDEYIGRGHAELVEACIGPHKVSVVDDDHSLATLDLRLLLPSSR